MGVDYVLEQDLDDVTVCVGFSGWFTIWRCLVQHKRILGRLILLTRMWYLCLSLQIVG